jgi:hypothetical protein
MGTRTFATGPTPQVIIEAVYGDLQIKGWERSEVLVNSSAEEGAGQVEQGDALRVHTRGDCLLNLPVGAGITITNVYGGAGIQGVSAALKIGRVLGSLQLLDVGESRIDSVYGELRLDHISGELSVSQVLGNAMLRDVGGSCSMERIAGNLDLRDVRGDIRASVGGNARLYLGSLPGKLYQVNSGGELVFRAPADADAQVSLSCGAGRIRIDIPAEINIYHERVHRLVLGSGEVKIELSAGGAIVFEAKEPDKPTEAGPGIGESLTPFLEDFSQQVATQIQDNMKILDARMARLSASIAGAGLPLAESERIMRQARLSQERAQEKMQRARERLDRKLAAAQRKVEQKERVARRRGEAQAKTYERPVPPAPPAPHPPPTPSGYSLVTDEERLIILRMLQEKKITLAEAEHLLAALDEKGS